KSVMITGCTGLICSAVIDVIIRWNETHPAKIHILAAGRSEQKVVKRFAPYAHKDWFVYLHYDAASENTFPIGCDYIIHGASNASPNKIISEPVETMLSNFMGVKRLLDFAKEHDTKRLLFISSSEVYGESVTFPQNEISTPLNSRVPYAVVKNAGEAFLRSYHKEFGLEYTIFRFFNTYGPKQSKDFVISKLLAKALKNEPITIYGDGTQSRTFCYIDDNIDACCKAAYDNLFVNDVVNIGNNNETSILDLAHLIIKLTGSKSDLVFLPPLKEGDMQRRLPDISNMKTLLNRPLCSLEEGIKRIINSPRFQI
ncbi:MAG: NAD-dependent epimerase/dehydratase family protein, partial [Bacteroidales bacterium]|nr:NAD-dependent epimerase/dehydratase family protein [Bacteroidales bacterium]